MKNFLLLSILSSLAFGVELPLEDKNYYLAQETLINTSRNPNRLQRLG